MNGDVLKKEHTSSSVMVTSFRQTLFHIVLDSQASWNNLMGRVPLSLRRFSKTFAGLC